MPNPRHRPDLQTSIAPGDYSVRTVSAAYTATEDDDVILCRASGSDVTVTLPVASRSMHKLLSFKRLAGAATISIAPASGTIDGDASYPLTVDYEAATLVTDGSNWFVLATA